MHLSDAHQLASNVFYSNLWLGRMRKGWRRSVFVVWRISCCHGRDDVSGWWAVSFSAPSRRGRLLLLLLFVFCIQTAAAVVTRGSRFRLLRGTRAGSSWWETWTPPPICFYFFDTVALWPSRTVAATTPCPVALTPCSIRFCFCFCSCSALVVDVVNWCFDKKNRFAVDLRGSPLKPSSCVCLDV